MSARFTRLTGVGPITVVFMFVKPNADGTNRKRKIFLISVKTLIVKYMNKCSQTTKLYCTGCPGFVHVNRIMFGDP